MCVIGREEFCILGDIKFIFIYAQFAACEQKKPLNSAGLKLIRIANIVTPNVNTAVAVFFSVYA